MSAIDADQSLLPVDIVRSSAVFIQSAQELIMSPLRRLATAAFLLPAALIAATLLILLWLLAPGSLVQLQIRASVM
jgi:hypothetical protein